MGTGVRRFDAPGKATGKALFPGDIKRPGLLFGKILRSDIAHGRIKRINTDKAQSLPGVVSVITAADFPDVKTGMTIQDQPVLAKQKVRYIGEPLAAVAAVDTPTADRAMDLIEVEIDELQGIFNFSQSIDPSAPLIHEGCEDYTSIRPLRRYGNVCLHTQIEKGDIDRGFAESDIIFEDLYTVPVVHQAPLEPRAVVAEMDHNETLRLWCSTARPFNIRQGVSLALGLSMSDIRVTGVGIGGGFGGKGDMNIEPIAAMLAIKSKKPVKIQMSRRDDFLAATPRHSMEISLKTGVKKDGTLLARKAEIRVDTGAYAYFGPNTTSNATLLITGPYDIPNLLIEGICVYTNKISCGPCRGPGAPQVHFAGESQLDRIARELGIDPIELRLKNALKEGGSTATGQVLGYVGYQEALTQLQSSLGTHLSDVGAAHDKEKALGIGIAGCFWGITGLGSGATIKLNEDGSVVLVTGAVEIGAGSNTAMALLVAEGLGVPLERIKVVSGDTDACPYDAGAVGSRTTQIMGAAVQQAVEGVKQQLLDFAEDYLDTPRELLVFGENKIYAIEKPEVAIPISKAVSYLTMTKGGPVIATASNTPPSPPFDHGKVKSHTMASKPFFAFGAQAAAVEVDKVTGKVDVLMVIAAHNVGKAIFREGIEGQIEGGVATGLGYALTEEVIFDEGRPLNDSFLDYRLPTMEDVPQIVPIIVEKENARSPQDILGVGEPPTIPTAAAIANAVYDAVGVRVNHLPLTPERVYWEMQRKKAASEN
ncbi:MAG: molybdopterin cofactor-binding domain-containing protein [Pseudomonadota bacterium]